MSAANEDASVDRQAYPVAPPDRELLALDRIAESIATENGRVTWDQAARVRLLAAGIARQVATIPADASPASRRARLRWVDRWSSDLARSLSPSTKGSTWIAWADALQRAWEMVNSALDQQVALLSVFALFEQVDSAPADVEPYAGPVELLSSDDGPACDQTSVALILLRCEQGRQVAVWVNSGLVPDDRHADVERWARRVVGSGRLFDAVMADELAVALEPAHRTGGTA